MWVGWHGTCESSKQKNLRKMLAAIFKELWRILTYAKRTKGYFLYGHLYLGLRRSHIALYGAPVGKH